MTASTARTCEAVSANWRRSSSSVAGLQHAAKRFGLERRDQSRDPLANPRLPCAVATGHLVGDLVQVVEHHPVVRDLLRLGVDGAGDEQGILGVVRRAAVPRQREVSEAEPERAGRRLRPLGRLVVVLQEHAGELGRLDPKVHPRGARTGAETERPGLALGIGRHARQQVVDLLQAHPAVEAHRRDAVPVKASGEVAEQGVARIGSGPGDDELLAGDADGQGLPRGEEGLEPVDESRGGFLEVGMPQRVHRALVQHDGELDEKVRQVPGQGRDRARARGVGEGVASLWRGAHGWPVEGSNLHVQVLRHVEINRNSLCLLILTIRHPSLDGAESAGGRQIRRAWPSGQTWKGPPSAGQEGSGVSQSRCRV